MQKAEQPGGNPSAGSTATIIVNGRPKKVSGVEIAYSEVVALAFDPVPENAEFTVTWSHGNNGGSLKSGQSVSLQNGMKFDVTATDKS